MRLAGVVLIFLVLLAGTADAQQPQKLPAVVFDLRGFYSGLGQDPITAGGIGLPPASLPKRGLGGVAGLHVYPLRKKVSLGLGGEAVLARGTAQEKDEMGQPLNPPVHQQLMGLSGGVSLNFGHRDGWSYLTAGIGPMSFGTYVGDEAPDERPPVQMTINLGGGARWFIGRHVAFSFDLRFYQTEPEVETASYPARQRSQLRVLSAGISIR